ncbi:hypothetical protein [Polymorphospora rubra]|uniref:Uncharacterized protein n=1 Tax=Polymorphospora rubra TaxID=338584 RepID=A0A810N0B4_9ACTN|nr:hypothetical protein [Polymorphospora rubra]BCJ65088.1 hypothetical protein Prubr_21090 [Polymorphospora rubra]
MTAHNIDAAGPQVNWSHVLYGGVAAVIVTGSTAVAGEYLNNALLLALGIGSSALAIAVIMAALVMEQWEEGQP